VRDEVRPILASHLADLGWEDLSRDLRDEEKDFIEAAALQVASGGADPKNEDIAAAYSVTLKGLCFAAQELHKDNAMARKWIEQAIALQNAILQHSPSMMQMVQERAGAYQSLAAISFAQGKLSEALDESEKSDKEYEFYLNLNPTDGKIRQFSVSTKDELAAFLRDFGRLKEARAVERASLLEAGKRPITSDYALSLATAYWNLAAFAAADGDRPGAEEALSACTHYLELWSRGTPEGGFVAKFAAGYILSAKAHVEFDLGDSPAVAQSDAREGLALLHGLNPHELSPRDQAYELELIADFSDLMARAALQQNKVLEAEASARESVAAWRSDFELPNGLVVPQLHLDYSSENLAEAIAGQGRYAEARAIIDPIESARRSGAAAVPESVGRRRVLADVLIIQEMAQEPVATAKRKALLDEAQTLLAGMPNEIVATRSYHLSMARIAAERANLDRKP
jgi:tetratricopeptide (TPR) repeat protein